MVELRGYQQDIDRAIDAAWASGDRNICAVLPTGAGKTIVFANKLAQTDGVRFAIAHRQELIAQISMALAKFGVVHRITAPAATIKWIIRLHTKTYGRHYYDPDSPCILISVQTLLRRVDSLANAIRAARLWVIDECFPPGTMVDGRPIETLSAGDRITAYNPGTGCTEKQKITWVFKNERPGYMVRLDIEGHHVVYSTLNHPFLTKRGWVGAGNLTVNDEVLCYGDSMHDVRGSSGYGSRTSSGIMAEKKAGVLLPEMRNGISSGRFLENNGGDESEIRKREDDKTEPHEKSCCQKKSIGHSETYRTPAKNTRGERAAAHGSRKTIARHVLRGWFLRPSGGKNRPLPRRVRVSALLQNRLRKLRPKNRYRSGRPESRAVIQAAARPEKRQLPEWKRVGNITIQKQRDTGNSGRSSEKSYVYNIEVSGPNTYAANGIVVHNCHHITGGNIWGKAVGLFPAGCKGLGVTATPLRSDGKGLGRHADGVFDTLVTGPGMRDLITAGYLTDYRIFAPQTAIDLSAVPVGSTGDYSKPKLVAAVRKSRIVGDVVDHYMRIAPGKLGVTFVTDVQTGRDTAERFRAAGVPSEIVHAKTADRKRQGIVESFGRGDVKNLVNVDIFGEGFDLPAMEVCSFARPTESYMLYVQQFGRGLRTMDGKGSAIIIDHVGNVMRHGLPDKPQVWSLDAREKRQSNGPTDVMPVRVCRVCTGVYEPYLKTCPYCGWVYEPDARATIEQVEGDLLELDPEALAAMRGERDRIDSPECGLERSGAPGIAVAGARKQHRLRQEAQAELRAAISGWADNRRAVGIPDHISYRDFYVEFGIDVMGAQLLGRPGATALMERLTG